MADKSEIVLPVLEHQVIKINGVEVKFYVFLTAGLNE